METQYKEIKSQYDIQDLIKMVKEEFYSPILLQYNHSLVNEFNQKLYNQLEKLSSMEKDENNDFIMDAMNLEIEHIKYLLKVYFRTRNRKIEKFIFFIVENEQSKILSDAEFDFAAGIYKLYISHYTTCFLSKIPEQFGQKMFQKSIQAKGGLRKETAKSNSKFIVEKPSEDRMVYVRAKRDLESFNYKQEKDIQLHKGDVRLLSFKDVKKMFMTGAFELL